jgi:phosphatidylinositol kinase/protein kinase (PI-3  family)
MDLEALHEQADEHARPMPRFAPALFTPTMEPSVVQSTQQSVASELNSKALAVIARVESKLIGRDFDPNITLDVESHVDRLIKEATSHVNLCQCYIGWCPFW